MSTALPFISTAISAYGASQAGKAGKVSAPPPRNYLREMQSALQGQVAIQEGLLQAERQYVPQWQQRQQEDLLGGVNSLQSLYGQIDTTGLQNRMAQQQGGVYGNIGVAARNAYQQTLDPTTAGLYSSLAGQAASGLASGRNLSDQEMRMAQGSARAAMAARGMQYGNQAIAAEVLNSYNLSNAREDRARAFAGQVYGIGQGNAQQAMSMYGQPLMNQIGALSPIGMVGQAGQFNAGLGAKLFQPESQYNAGIYGANQSNDMQASLARSQAQAGFGAGLMNLGGTLGKAYLSNPNLFGSTTSTTTNIPTTPQFNSWMNGGSLPTISAPTYTYGG